LDDGDPLDGKPFVEPLDGTLVDPTGDPLEDGDPLSDPLEDGDPLEVGDPLEDGEPLGDPLEDGDPLKDGDPLEEGDPLEGGDPLEDGDPLDDPLENGEPLEDGDADSLEGDHPLDDPMEDGAGDEETPDGDPFEDIGDPLGDSDPLDNGDPLEGDPLEGDPLDGDDTGPLEDGLSESLEDDGPLGDAPLRPAPDDEGVLRLDPDAGVLRLDPDEGVLRLDPDEGVDPDAGDHADDTGLAVYGGQLLAIGEFEGAETGDGDPTAVFVADDGTLKVDDGPERLVLGAFTFDTKLFELTLGDAPFFPGTIFPELGPFAGAGDEAKPLGVDGLHPGHGVISANDAG